MADSKLIPIAALAVGGLFLWSAIRDKSILSATQVAIRGQSPTTATKLPETSPSITSQVAGVVGSTTIQPGSALSTAQASGGKGTFTHAALMALWVTAGGSASAANNAACHAIQESSGRPWVTSSNPDGGTNVGLWQLDTPGGKGAGYTIAQLQNPFTNARVAIKGSSDGRDWSAWATPGC